MTAAPKWTPGPDDEHYTRLSIHETEHTHPDCGCTLRQGPQGIALYQCPLHAAAPDMAEALKAIQDLMHAARSAEKPRILAICAGALAKAGRFGGRSPRGVTPR